MKTAARLLIAALSMATLSVVSAGPSIAACKVVASGWGSASKGYTCPQAVGWSYDPRGRVFTQGSRILGLDAPDDPLEYLKASACEGDAPGGSEPGCVAAASCPVVLGSDGVPLSSWRVNAYSRPRGSDAPWNLIVRNACEYVSEAVPLADVEAAAREQMEREVGTVEVTVQPPGGTVLVNMPTLFSAPAWSMTSLPVTAPVPGVVTAVPAYSWDLGDGLTGTGSGHVYTPQVRPDGSGSDGFYVAAVYERAGVKRVTATLEWTAAFELQGYGSIPLAPIRFTDTVGLQAREARSVLVSN